MAGLNHERPLFKVMAAGGGERIRTIAEDLAVAQVGLGSADKAVPERPRCELCGSRHDVTGQLSPRCAGCRAHEAAVRAARKTSGGDIRSRAARKRANTCGSCHVELPATGVCGYCG
jgi:hypothetical protein